MPTHKKDDRQNKSQSGRQSEGRNQGSQNLTGQGRDDKLGSDRSKARNKDRVGMNSDRDDSRKGTQASGRQKSDDLDAGYHVGSGTGAHQRSDPSNRR
jgi:hypothetical protein